MPNLPAEISGCRTTGRQRTYHEPGQNDRQHLKLRQRTRYCPRTGTGTMQEYRDARCPPKYPVAARPGGSACATSPGREHGTATPAGTGTMQEYRDARCPPKCPVAARPKRQRTYHEPGQNDRQHLKLRQRTRYCHPCRNRHNAGIQGCPLPAEMPGCRTTKAAAHVPHPRSGAP